MTAEYVRVDSSLHGKEGDSFKFSWVTVEEAIAMFSVYADNKHYEANQSKTQGLLVFKEFVAKRDQAVSLESHHHRSLPVW